MLITKCKLLTFTRHTFEAVLSSRSATDNWIQSEAPYHTIQNGCQFSISVESDTDVPTGFGLHCLKRKLFRGCEYTGTLRSRRYRKG